MPTTPRLILNDIVVHRVYGRARLQAIYSAATEVGQCQIRVMGEKAPRRVWLRDCEKAPRPLRREPLRLVR